MITKIRIGDLYDIEGGYLVVLSHYGADLMTTKAEKSQKTFCIVRVGNDKGFKTTTMSKVEIKKLLGVNQKEKLEII